MGRKTTNKVIHTKQMEGKAKKKNRKTFQILINH